jgi:hypothetical protein
MHMGQAREPKNCAKLTNRLVEKYRCRSGRTQDVLWDLDKVGLGLRVSADGRTRSYFVQHRVKGEPNAKYITIGRHDAPWRLETDNEETDVRQEAERLMRAMRRGTDPIKEEKRKQVEAAAIAAKEAAQSTTLRQVLAHYLVNKRTKHGELRPATKRDLRWHVEVNLVDWADQPVSQITRDKCLAKFTEITERGAGAQANGMAVYLRALLNHAREMHADNEGNYTILATNPVTRMFKLRKRNAEKARKTRIPLAKVGAVYSMLRKRAAEARTVHERTAADWVSAMLLTGWRKTESGSLLWTDIDFEQRTVTLRAEVVKNHNEVTLPLSDELHNLLVARKSLRTAAKALRRRTRDTRADVYVFASNGRKTEYMTDARATMDAVSAVAGHHLSPHDLRRTAEDIAKACKVDPDERRQLLNHLASDVHGQSYSNNPDPKVLLPAVESIAKYVVDAATVAQAQASGANVVSFPVKAG